MNRSLLLVICDFLLLSLLSLARFDDPESAQENRDEVVQENAEVELMDPMVVLLQQSLQEEQAQQQKLSESLQSVEEALLAKEQSLQSTAEQLTQVQQEAQERAEALAQEQVEKERLVEEKRLLAQQQERLQAQKAEVERDRETLQGQVAEQEKDLAYAQQQQEQLQANADLLAGQVQMSAEQLTVLQQELQAKAATLQQTQQRLQETEAKQEALRAEKEAAQNQLQLVEVERELLEKNLQTEALRRENLQKQTDRLTEGVAALAENSAALKEEFVESQELSANALFQQFTENAVAVAFDVTMPGAFGFGEKQVAMRTSAPVVRLGDRYVLPLPLAQTPWAQKVSAAEPLAVSGRLQVAGRSLPIAELMWSAVDPRWAWIELDAAWVAQVGVQVFDVVEDVSRFADAILLHADGDYYGNVGYKLHAQRPAYLRMDDRILTRLLGEFRPQEGDYLFSKNGRFLGLMLSSSTARILNVMGTGRAIALSARMGEQSWQRQVNQSILRIPGDVR